ncbi:ABC transporter ATP-binding protein [Actinokineospora sp. NBRC 105648]|uniref:ABC transporter ATP-binding protein n=1 Tax=Actinokineospora sp. NBRC 105648 TaxID=3032206 RepID=UPI00249FF0CE|nr:ABC transporter ATP-binding protein [Actinokineospora sp. NBRC 105648]GLZ36642.1 multidrug ABC transporter ATP-binding protein [Actinokineospora sp. NBRC 105648]
MITLRGLTKRYGETLAVDDLTLEIAAGKVTGFLGPNGAGKSTTMRMIVGLDHPSAGEALIDGRPYGALRNPIREVGALLDAKALHPGRTAHNHLLAMAHTHGLPAKRVAEVLDTVGLATVAHRRAGGFSLGMFQRLGIAGALLGDPRVLIFDEPVNGLDPDGVRWVRELVRSLAAEGRTIFISSHLMSEMQLTADQLVIIGRGRLIADAPIAELIARSSLTAVQVRVPDPDHLATLREGLARAGMAVREAAEDQLVVRGGDLARVGDLVHQLGVRVHELRMLEASLEEAYMELTAASVEFGVAAGGPEARA